MSPQRLARLAVLGALALTVAACPGAPASPELTDPREILGRTITTTAGLRTMHVRFDAEVRNGAAGQAPQGIFIEGDVDLPAGELSARGASRDGTGGFAMILAEGAIFVQNDSAERWTKIPMIGLDAALLFGRAAGLGQGQAPDYLGVIVGVAADARTGLELRGIEACETGRCYRTAITISREQIWPIVVKLLGLDRFPGGAAMQPPADQLPTISIEILTDTATERLVDLVGSATVAGTTISLGLRISAPNQPVQIQAPPPDLVENFGGFGF